MIDAERFRPAIEHLAREGFIAYPTETVWGLGACADRPRALERLMDWKGRSADAPMSILVRSTEAVVGIGCEMVGPAKRLAAAFWPGPLTLVVPCDQRFASGIAGADGALGLRCSPHPIAHALAVAVDSAGLAPLTSTSMNRTGEPPAETFAAAEGLLSGQTGGALDLPFLVPCGEDDAGGGKPSSVVDCTGAVPRVLRAGSIDVDRLEKIWSETEPI